MGTALHGIRLQVAPEDEERASALLRSAFPDEIQEIDRPETLEAADVAEVCPVCGSDAIGPQFESLN